MYVFKIDPENRVTAHAGTKRIHAPEGEHCFADPKELARLIKKWPATRVSTWLRSPKRRRRSLSACGYVRSKMELLWVSQSLFGEIHRRTGGVPRMITALCGAAIERCEETQARAVDQELLEQVASEFGI
jgi:hypothetical protein